MSPPGRGKQATAEAGKVEWQAETRWDGWLCSRLFAHELGRGFDWGRLTSQVSASVKILGTEELVFRIGSWFDGPWHGLLLALNRGLLREFCFVSVVLAPRPDSD